MQSKVHARSAESEAASEVLAQESLEERFRTLESEDRVELLLQEIKSRMEERQAAVG
jgi:phage shock protein A